MTLSAGPGALGQSVSCHRQRADQCRRHCDRGTFACRNSKTRLHRISEKDSRWSWGSSGRSSIASRASRQLWAAGDQRETSGLRRAVFAFRAGTNVGGPRSLPAERENTGPARDGSSVQ